MARKMKDSGIEWIGEIPEGWRTINPKALFTQRKDKAQKGEPQLTSSQQYGILYQDDYMELTGSKVVTVEKDFDILKHVEAGDFVISMRSFQGGLEYSTKSGAISSAYVMLVPNLELVYPRFYRWLLKSSVYIDALQRTTSMVRDGQAMRYSNFAQVRLFTLPLDEQKSRADFLDLECSSIDKILFKTRSSIEEYKKLKQAVITQAVTKGVRGERKMKDSGVEWIGEIPEEWNKCKLKNISIDIGDGLHGTPKFDDSGEVYFINGNNFSSEYVEPKFDTKKLCLEESLNYPKPELTEQTIMISLNGSYGKVCLYRYFPMLLGKSAGYITLLPSINRRYVRYYLSSTPAQTIMTLSLNGTTIPNLSLNTLYNFPTILPSASEQAEIADYLDAKCAEIDGLIAKKEQLVKELESYKKSLIYEVVTGKREV